MIIPPLLKIFNFLFKERLNNIGPEEFVQTFIKSPADSGVLSINICDSKTLCSFIGG